MTGGLTMTMTGWDQAVVRLKNLADVEATKAGQAAIRAGATLLARKVRDRAPVSNVAEGTVTTRHNKGGTTRQEPHHKIKNNIATKKVRAVSGEVTTAVYVKSKAYHASFVEHGSIHNTPNPFMLSAFQQSSQEIIDKVGVALGKQLTKGGA